MTDFSFLKSKNTTVGDCSQEKSLAPWKKSYDKSKQHTKKQRHHFANRSPYGESYGFLSSHVQMWELNHKECWTLKNWWFWTTVLEKTLESHLDFKEINQSILKEINPEYSLEGLMLKLKLQYFGYLVWRADSLEKTWERLKAGGEGNDRGWDCWMASLTQWTWLWENYGR